MGLPHAILLAALPALCIAQQAQAPVDPTLRGRAFGLVRDRDGEVWRSARVTLLSRPLPSIEQIGSADRIDVVTDERGRFRADVLPNRPYSVWAVQWVGDRYRHTNIAENVFPNVPVILVEAGDPRPVRSLRIAGTEAWKNNAPLRAQVVGTANNAWITPLDLDAGAEALLPAMAGSECTVELYTESGQPLWQQVVSLTETGTIELTLPPPFPILVVVRNKAGTVPLAGARILQQVRQGWAPMAETGADGIAVLSLALERAQDGRATWRHRVLLAEAEGHSPGSLITVRMDLTRDKDAEVLRAAGDVDAYAGLEPVPMLRGRVMLTADEPAAETDLVLYGRYASFRNGSSTAGSMVQFLRTDADGRFATPSPQASSGFRLCAVLDEAQLAQLFSDSLPIPHPLALLAHDGQSVPNGGILGDLRIDQLCPLDIAVSHEDRTPAPHATLGYSESPERNSQDLQPCGFVADRHGRLRILIPTTDQLLLGAVRRGAGEIVLTGVTAHAGIERPIALDLMLTRPHRIQGQVTDSAGTPLTGAQITCFPTYRSRSPSNRAARPGLRPPPAGRNTLTIFGEAQWETNWSLTSLLLKDISTHSDENGNYTLPVPSPALQYYVRANIQRDGTTRNSSAIAVRFRDQETEDADLVIDFR